MVAGGLGGGTPVAMITKHLGGGKGLEVGRGWVEYAGLELTWSSMEAAINNHKKLKNQKPKKKQKNQKKQKKKKKKKKKAIDMPPFTADGEKILPLPPSISSIDYFISPLDSSFPFDGVDGVGRFGRWMAPASPLLSPSLPWRPSDAAPPFK